jgi:multiple sugar transport system ATP-binding protein
MQTSGPQATAGVGPRAGSRAGRSLGHLGRRERPRPGADRRHCNASLASLQRKLGVTTVYVTYDQGEAMTMGDRVAGLKDGVLQQVDTPAWLLAKPANVFVAGFIGSQSMNLFRALVDVGGHPIPLTCSQVEKAEGEVVIGGRPERLD